MPIIKLPEPGANKSFKRISDAGASLGDIARNSGQGLLNLGAGLSAAGKEYFGQVREAESNREYTQNMTQATIAYNKAYAERVATKVDDKGNPTYVNLVDDINGLGQGVLAETLKGMTNPAARAKMEQNFTRFVGNKSIQAFQNARTQQMDFGKATLYKSLEANANEALKDDPSNINHYRSSMEDSLDSSLKAGLISFTEHEKLTSSSMKALNKSVYNSFIRRDPDAALDVFSDRSSDELGISEKLRQTLVDDALAGIKQEVRQEKIEDKERDRVKAAEQNRMYDDLNLEIVDDRDNEKDIRAALSDERIDKGQAASLLKKLKVNNKARNKDLTSFKSIDGSLSRNSLITEAPGQVDKHYAHSVTLASPEGKPLTLPQKATIASRYNAPVRAFQKELSFKARSENSKDNAEALQAYRFARERGTYVVDGMDKKSSAILESARNLTENTGMSDGAAMRAARKKVLDVSPEQRLDVKREYKRIEDFKPKNIEDTIKEMYDIDSFLGFGGSDLPVGIRREIEDLLEEAYGLTGDKDAAIELVKAWTKNTMGTTEINGEKEFTLFPIEATNPDLSTDQIRGKLEKDVETLLPGVSPENVKLEADELSRIDPNNVTYQLYEEKDIGDGAVIKEAIISETGVPLRWKPDTGAVKKEDSLGRAREERTRAFEEQVEFVNKPTLSARLRSTSGKLIRGGVLGIIDEAGDTVGVDSSILAAIAKVESGLRPGVKAGTSSATGLFQFIDSTWRGMVKKYGKEHGIKLGDKKDPRANAIMGALFTRDNTASLRKALGREPGIREIYLAHFSGVGTAIKVLRKIDSNPNAPVESVYSAAAIRANKGILRGTLKDSFTRLTNKVVRAQRSLK